MKVRYFFYITLLLGSAACSVVNGKTKLERYLDGEMPGAKAKDVSPKPQSNIEESDSESSWLFGDDFESTQKEASNSATETQHKQLENTSQSPSSTEALALEEPELRCLASDNVSFSYRKRVAVLPMTLVQRRDAVDIPFIEREFSQALTARLGSEPRLTPYDASSYYELQPYSERSRLSRPLDPDLVRATAQELNTQFVVAGKLLDVSFERTDTHSIDLVSSLKGWKSLAREAYQRATDSYWRRLNMELSIYDGPSGALIKRQRFSGEANHPINVERHQGLESHTFWQSDYGQLVDKTLNDQAIMISRALECLPMRAQVSRVDFDVIEINAGLDANLMPGDRLRIFHREPAGRDPQGVPKHRWKYYGGVTIKGVFPLKSIAVLDDGLAPDVIDLGDIVQAW
mgnify:CR=1 FL=1